MNTIYRTNSSIINNLILVLFTFMSCGQDKEHELSLPSLFADGMILQRDTLVSIWGKSTPNQLVTLNSSWGSIVSIQSDNNGDWIVRIPTNNNPGPHSFTITSGKNIKNVDDVLFGEVWLAAG